jgi:hypothetical protein
VLLAAVAVAVLLLAGGSGDEAPPVDPAIAAQQNYHQAQYDAGVSVGWPQGVSDRRVGRYLESAWHDGPVITYFIDSRASDETSSPLANAELARMQARHLPGYRERGMREIVLWTHPSVRLAYDVAGEAYVEYFFEECDTSFVVRGSMPPESWPPITEFMRGQAETITATCDE